MPLALIRCSAAVALVLSLSCTFAGGVSESRQAELNYIREQCYSCLGPNSPDCSEVKLKTYTRRSIEVLCGAPFPH
jgi:hypothetical protein